MRLKITSMLALLLSAVVPGGAMPAGAQVADSADVSAEALLARYYAASDPELDATRHDDEAYMADWVRRRDAAWKARYEAAVDLARRYPDHPRVADVLSEGMTRRYYVLAIPAANATGDPGNPEAWAAARRQVHDELASWLAEENLSPDVRHALTYVQILHRLLRDRPTNEQIAALLPTIEELRRADPGGDRPRELLYWAASVSTGDLKIELLRRLAAEEAETTEGKWAAGLLRRSEAMGKPFEFAFDDLLTGRRITSEDLKGKVVVIDFWGTWCGICLAMTPDLKAAYEKYRGRGVEFIGVVLEDPAEAGAREKAFAYLEKEKVPWPQWYQEQGWDSDFALSYGVSDLPAVFVVDAEGNLRSRRGRPDQDLDEVVTELLAERDAANRSEAK